MPVWTDLPAVIEVGSYDENTKTLVGSTTSSSNQSWTNIFLEAPTSVVKTDAYVHAATARALLAEVILLFHFFPQLSALVPVRGQDYQRNLRAAISSVRA